MPVDVIDLSSPIIAPSNPPPRHTTVNNSTNPARKPPTSLPADFIDIAGISSDDDPLPPPRARMSARPSLAPPTAALKRSSELASLSDEIDSIFDLTQPYDFPAAKTAPSPSAAPSPRRSPVAVAGVNALPSKNAPKQHGMQRSVSSVETVNARARKAAGFKRVRTSVGIKDDPIIWTSSPEGIRDQVRETAARRMTGEDRLRYQVSSDPFASSPAVERRTAQTMQEANVTMGMDIDPFPSSSVAERRVEPRVYGVERANTTDRMHNDAVASSPIAQRRAEPKPSELLVNGKEEGVDSIVDSSDFDVPFLKTLLPLLSQRPPDGRKSSAALREYLADKKKRDKEKEKAEKAAEKAAEKERKQIAREEKARERLRKQELDKVNTLKTDKKVSTPEMILDLPVGLEARLEEQVKAFMGTLGVEVTEWNSLVQNVIRWKRKVVAIYDEEKGRWEPCASHIKTEDHVLVVVAAQEFVDLATADEGNDLDAHASRMKALFGDHIIYLIEGLMPWMRKNRNLRNRQYIEAVRAMEAEPAQTKGKGKKTAEYVDEDSIEDALLKLQVLNGVFIHHTNAMVETAEWIVAFTQHISTIPYRKEKMSLDTNFCMATGQIKSGENPFDTYVRMLQEIVRITAPIAHGIAAKYPTVQSLVKGLKENGPECLEGCRKATNNDGSFSDRNIGVAISRRVHKIFLGRDVESVDI